MARNCVLYRKSFLLYWLLYIRAAASRAALLHIPVLSSSVRRTFCIRGGSWRGRVRKCGRIARNSANVVGLGVFTPSAALIQLFKDTEHSVITKVLRLKFQLIRLQTHPYPPLCASPSLVIPHSSEVPLVGRLSTGVQSYVDLDARGQSVLLLLLPLHRGGASSGARLFALDWPSSHISDPPLF